MIGTVNIICLSRCSAWKKTEEIKTNTDTGRVVLSDEEKKKYPASSMRKPLMVNF